MLAACESETQDYQELLASFPPFVTKIEPEYRRSFEHLDTMQVNIGYKCNIACRHCHLQCSPSRTEEMDRETMAACLEAYQRGGFKLLDVTGGAPEMNPDLEWFLREAQKIGAKAMVRTNLCILMDPQYHHFIRVYDETGVDLFASLPFYEERNNDKIRGAGVFVKNIEALRELNAVGYGTGKHALTLVFNPAGPTLSPDQDTLEAEYRRRLRDDHGVEFTNLVAIANMPCGRFAEALHRKGRLAGYIDKLIDAFNPETVPGMMCLSQISVDWKGDLFDCDFHQAMRVPIARKETIFDWAREAPRQRPIAFRNWCYCCTAGAGSS